VTTDLSQLYSPNQFPQDSAALPISQDSAKAASQDQGTSPHPDPQKDFSTTKSGYSTAYWVAAGAGVLIATGMAAFTSFKHGSEPPSDFARSASHSSISAAQPEHESESTAHAAFGDDAPDLGASDESEVAEHQAGAPGPAAALPGVPQTQAKSPESALAQADAPPADTLAPGIPGAFYVQLASYRTKETADEHAKALVARGFSAQSIAYGGPAAGWWHAVRLGPFEDRVSAEKSRFDLEPSDRRASYVLPRSNGKFHVQVASFAEREEAEQVAKTFSASGHSTKVTRVKMSGSYWHCVRIGPFDTREEALAYKALVPDVPGSQSTVIPFPPAPAR